MLTGQAPQISATGAPAPSCHGEVRVRSACLANLSHPAQTFRRPPNASSGCARGSYPSGAQGSEPASGPLGPALARRHASYKAVSVESGRVWRILCNATRGRGQQDEDPGGGRARQPSRPFCPSSTSVFSPRRRSGALLSSPVPSLPRYRLDPNRRQCRHHWSLPGSPAFFLLPLLLPPPVLSRGACAEKRTRPSPAGVTEDSRARAPAAPPALSPGPFGERGRE